MDSGQRLILYNVIGKPFYRWDSLRNTIHTEYDALHRVQENILTSRR